MTLNLLKTSNVYYNKLFVDTPAAGSGTGSSSGVTGRQLQVLPGSKAKVLLVDENTTPIISMCYTQSQLLSNDVILVELIEKQATLNPMKHLQCVCYLKPTAESIQHLIRELKNPHYNSYQIFFNNTVNKSQIEKLAESDEFELVQLVIEIFQDYLIINDNLFTTSPLKFQQQLSSAGGNGTLVDVSTSVISLLLLIKKCPIIKYETNSKELRKLSSEILYAINSNSNNNLFDDVNSKLDTPPILLLLDRKNDPITPLLSPWTYQSMIHELIGIQKNIVKVGNEQLTLSEQSDSFYKDSMYLNYGDLTDKVQKYVEEYKTQTKQTSTENLQTKNLADLKNFLIKFPEFKKFSSNVSKHLNLVSELDKMINQQHLWELGELQQTIVADLESHSSIKLKIHQILDNYTPPQQQRPQVTSTLNKVKLVLLYALRYENTNKPENETDTFINKLSNPNLTSPPPTLSQLLLLRSFKKYIGISRNRTDSRSTTSSSRNSTDGVGLFNGKKFNQFFNKSLNNTSNSNQPDNIYMQHIPKLYETLTSLIQEQQLPNNHQQQTTTDQLTTLIPEAVTRQFGNATSDSIQDIIIYIQGGVTYEEARLIHEWNNTTKMKLNIIIGGDSILNSSSWLDNLCDLVNAAETNVLQELPNNRGQLRDLL